MGNIILCVGKYAKNPYLIKKSSLKLYSIEELCYFLCENLVFLDKDIMDKELVSWLGTECGLEELAKKLSLCLKKKATLNIFVITILEGAYYCTAKELKEVDKQLSESADLNSFEKRKGKMDYYLKNGKYLTALRGYEQLRLELGDDDLFLTSKISHNIGVLHAKNYNFECAADNFKEAYELAGNIESYLAYLAARRMMLKDEEYVDFIASGKENMDLSLELEKKLESLEVQWEYTEDKKKLEELQAWKHGKRAADYYEAVEQLIGKWEENYRDNLLNP